MVDEDRRPLLGGGKAARIRRECCDDWIVASVAMIFGVCALRGG